MSDEPKPTVFAAQAGISIPYASQILSGVRTPSRPLAISIFQRTGLKLGPIAQLSDDDIATLARIDGIAA
jgi:hypothetical protein